MISLQWVYGTGVCHARPLLSQVRCIQLRCSGSGDLDREEEHRFLRLCQLGRPSKLCEYGSAFVSPIHMWVLIQSRTVTSIILVSLKQAWERWTAGRGFEILDPVLGIQFPSSDMLKCIKVGLLCVQENPVDRPKMSTVNVMLNSDSVSLPAPSRPAFCVGKSSMDPNSNKSILGTKNQTTQSVTMSPNEVSISELEPR